MSMAFISHAVEARRAQALVVMVLAFGLLFCVVNVTEARADAKVGETSTHQHKDSNGVVLSTHNPDGTPATTAARGSKAPSAVKVEGSTGTVEFLDTALGGTLKSVAKLGGIALALWGVVKAASKGFGREGGGIGAFAKGLVVPMIAAAFLYNLQWAFTLLGWAISIVEDLFKLIGGAF